jgi:hypothetical protein
MKDGFQETIENYILVNNKVVMITCYLKYTIDPFQLDTSFEDYGKRWIKLANSLEDSIMVIFYLLKERII